MCIFGESMCILLFNTSYLIPLSLFIFLFVGDMEHVLTDVLVQLQGISGTIPECKRAFKQQTTTDSALQDDLRNESDHRSNTTLPDKADSVPSGRRKMEAILELHNKYRQIFSNNLDRTPTQKEQELLDHTSGKDFHTRVNEYYAEVNNITTTIEPNTNLTSTVSSTIPHMESSEERLLFG